MIVPGDQVTWDDELYVGHHPKLWAGPGDLNTNSLAGPTTVINPRLPVLVVCSRPHQTDGSIGYRLLVLVGNDLGWIWCGWVKRLP